MWQFVKRVLASRLGHLLLITNLCFVIYEYGRSLRAAGRDCLTVADAQRVDAAVLMAFPVWVVVFTILNFPALMVSSFSADFITSLYPQMCTYTAAHIESGSLAFCSAIQWMLVGYAIESQVRRKRSLVSRT